MSAPRPRRRAPARPAAAPARPEPRSAAPARTPATPATPAPPQSAGATVLGWAGVVLLVGCGLLTAMLEAMLVPTYAGATILPIAPVLAVASNVLLPVLANRLVATLPAAGAPFGAWLVGIILLGFVTRPEGDVILPGGSLQWVAFATIIGGTLAGTITVVTVVPRRAPPPAAPRRPGVTR